FLIGIILVSNLFILTNAEKSYLNWGGFIVLPILIVYMLICVTLLTLLVRSQIKLLELVKRAFIMSVSHLFSSLGILICLICVTLATIRVMPVLVFFFYPSLIAWMFTWQTRRIIDNISRMKGNSENVYYGHKKV